MSCSINVSQEECQNNVNAEKNINNSVHSIDFHVGRFVHESNFEGIHPCRISHQKNHKTLPTPAHASTKMKNLNPLNLLTPIIYNILFLILIIVKIVVTIFAPKEVL